MAESTLDAAAKPASALAASPRCPAGVHFGAMMEHTRGALEEARPGGLRRRFLRWLGLRAVLPRRLVLRLAGSLLRAAQALRLDALSDRLFGDRGVRFLPRIAPLSARRMLPSRTPAEGTPRGHVLLLEGSGGLLTPFTWEWTVVDLARSVGAAALLVGTDRLGTINLALMTLSALELAGLEVAGMVLTTPEIPDASTGTNAASIGRLSGLDRIVALPRLADPLMAGDTMEAVIGWLG